MGVRCPNETKCLYKILSNGETLKKNFYANLNLLFLMKELLDTAIKEK